LKSSSFTFGEKFKREGEGRGFGVGEENRNAKKWLNHKR